MVSDLHPYVTESAAEDVDREFTVLQQQLHDLDHETAQVADEVATTRDRSARLQAQFTQFDSQLQAADESVVEMSCFDVDKVTSEDAAAVEVRLCLSCVFCMLVFNVRVVAG